MCNGNTFYSPQLNEVMTPFEQRRVRIEAYKRQKQKENSLKISGEVTEKGDIVSFEGKGEGKGKGTTTSNKEDGGGDGASVPTVLAWEWYVNELLQEQQWIEVMPSIISVSFWIRAALPSRSCSARNVMTTATGGEETARTETPRRLD